MLLYQQEGVSHSQMMKQPLVVANAIVVVNCVDMPEDNIGQLKKINASLVIEVMNGFQDKEKRNSLDFVSHLKKPKK